MNAGLLGGFAKQNEVVGKLGKNNFLKFAVVVASIARGCCVVKGFKFSLSVAFWSLSLGFKVWSETNNFQTAVYASVNGT